MDKIKYPETLEEARDYENARIPGAPYAGEIPPGEWLKVIFEPRKLTHSPMLFSTGVICELITDRSYRITDAQKAHWLTEIARHEATPVHVFFWEFPEGYEFPPELGLPL